LSLVSDTHGKICERIANIDQEKYPPNETALIILGDAGINYYLNNTDKRNKKNIQNTGYTIYCVRGNHEERPSKVADIHPLFDEEVSGVVMFDWNYPNIRYFEDGGVYNINGKSVLVIGGAYSVDKWHRLTIFDSNAKEIKTLSPSDNDYWNPKKTGWFPDEQLTPKEMENIEKEHSGKHYDFILTHTCPLSWEPRDLFLPFLDQSTVDASMEEWLEGFKDKIYWGIWLFGHFHDDRLVRPRVEMYYRAIEDLADIIARQENPDNLDWWMKKDPNYYLG
jgi:3-oxoacid CoA-transferase subunit A